MKTSHLLVGFTSAVTLGMAAASGARADDAPAAPTGPTALTSPAMSATLAANANPTSADVGLFGKIYFSGQFTGLGTWQNNPVTGNNSQGKADLSNAQIEIQKTDGVVQFYVQVGEYTFPSLGSAYVGPGRLTDHTFKAVPVAYLKLQPTAEWSFQIGKLPTLIGAEYTFTFQNFNIARGLLWNQEPAISRGVQANYAKGPLTVSMSWNDGYYSNKFDTASGLVAYVVDPKDTLAFAASGSFKKVNVSSFVTPVAQANGTVWNVIWTHTDGPWTVSPYLQYTTTPKYPIAGLPGSASTFGGAVLAKYSFNSMFNLAGRAEYISSSGSQVSLLYGPNSKAWSFTVTPTWQFKTFFVRGEASWTKLDSVAPGSGFGKAGDKDSQSRAMLETGVLF